MSHYPGTVKGQFQFTRPTSKYLCPSQSTASLAAIIECVYYRESRPPSRRGYERIRCKLFNEADSGRNQRNHRDHCRERIHLKNTFQIDALLSLLAFIGVPFAHAAQNSPSRHPDAIFTPTISPVVCIDMTGRPVTVALRQPEPRLAQSMVASNVTGDRYDIHFPQGDAG